MEFPRESNSYNLMKVILSALKNLSDRRGVSSKQIVDFVLQRSDVPSKKEIYLKLKQAIADGVKKGILTEEDGLLFINNFDVLPVTSTVKDPIRHLHSPPLTCGVRRGRVRKRRSTTRRRRAIKGCPCGRKNAHTHAYRPSYRNKRQPMSIAEAIKKLKKVLRRKSALRMSSKFKTHRCSTRRKLSRDFDAYSRPSPLRKKKNQDSQSKDDNRDSSNENRTKEQSDDKQNVGNQETDK